MKQNLIPAALGLVVLAALVAFSLLPRPGDEESAGEQTADPSSAAVVQAACREFELGMAESDLDEALENIGVALGLEREGGDGGAGYEDWLDPELVTSVLTDVVATARAAGLTPHLPEEVYDPLREVVRAASGLERAAVSGSMLVVGEIEDGRQALVAAVADVERACA
jgi:hypothetical protein